MGKSQGTLTPWYAVNDDPWLYHPLTARESGADWEAHCRGNRNRNEMNRQASLTKEQKRSMVQSSSRRWLIDITIATRKALHKREPYSHSDTREWYERQKSAGLKDVFFVFDDWAKGVLQAEDRLGIICWYAFGKTSYTTISVDDYDKTVLIEKQLLIPRYKKPELHDNSEALFQVLMQLADWSKGLPYWEGFFLKAANTAKEGNLMKAYEQSQTGSGMGSWMDTPIATDPKTRQLNQRLYDERSHALMYAINFC